MARVIHVVFDAHLGGRQDALHAQATKAGCSRISQGDSVVFINRAQDKLAVLTPAIDGSLIMGYYRSPHGKLDLRAVKHIPTCWGGSGFDYSKAIAKSLEDRGIVVRESGDNHTKR